MYIYTVLVYIVFNAEQIVLFYAIINGIRSVYSSVVEVIRVMPSGTNTATFSDISSTGYLSRIQLK